LGTSPQKAGLLSLRDGLVEYPATAGIFRQINKNVLIFSQYHLLSLELINIWYFKLILFIILIIVHLIKFGIISIK
jgi:hypothetical protein